MKIYKITEASDYLGVSINTLKTLANNGKVKSFKTTGEHRRFRQEDLDAYMGFEKDINGGGNEHRRRDKITNLYLWAIQNNFPSIFQVLCFNCNHGKQLNGGVCPHKV